MAAKTTNISVKLSVQKRFCSYFFLKYIIYSLFSTLILFAPLKSVGQAESQSLEYKIKAAYLYNFTKFIIWPEKIFESNKKKTFNICILKHNPFGRALDLLKNKLVRGIVLATEIVEPKESLGHCQIVYFPIGTQEIYSDILDQLKQQHILTVSDISGFANNGGHIGLETVKGKVRFDINLGATKSAELKVSAKLLELAMTVIEQ